MPWSKQKLQAPVSEEIEILIELDPVIAASRNVIVQNERPTLVGLGPVGVANFVSPSEELGFGKIGQAAGMVRCACDRITYLTSSGL